MQSTYRLCISVYGQTVRWCDEGAYLLANQLLDKFQSKEGAQAALQDIEKLMETDPSVLQSNPDILSLEFEAILTPQLQVLTHFWINYSLFFFPRENNHTIAYLCQNYAQISKFCKPEISE